MLQSYLAGNCIFKLFHKLSHFFQELAQMEEKFKRMNLFPEIDLGDISQQEREEGQEWRAEI